MKVARNAPPEIIRAAYKALSQKYHPDKNKSSSESERIMKIINDSYRVLSRPEERKKHDEWIRQSENGSNDKTATSNASKSNPSENRPPVPFIGEFYSSELDPASLNALKDRVAGRNKDQYAVKQEGVVKNFIWLLILSSWFVFLFVSAQDYRWSDSTLNWYVAFTCITAFFLSRNLIWIVSWFSTPFKSWLILTPLYLIRLRLDKVSFWPLLTMNDMKATYNYMNGAYVGTSFTITFNNKKEDFFIKRKKKYIKFTEYLNEYRQKIRLAVSANNLNYFVENNEFFKIHQRVDEKVKKKKILSVIIIYITVFFYISTNSRFWIFNKQR